MTLDRNMAWRSEGVGYGPTPARQLAHKPLNWFETGYDETLNDPDAAFVDPLPTARHERVPGFDYGDS